MVPAGVRERDEGLDDAEELLGIIFDDEVEFTTVGGHVFGELGHKPQPGDSIETDDYTLIVESADRHRIIKLRLIKKQLPENESNGNGSASGPDNGKVDSSKPAETTK